MSTVTDLTSPCGTQAYTEAEEKRQKGRGQRSQRTQKCLHHTVFNKQQHFECKFKLVLKVLARHLINDTLEYSAFKTHWLVLEERSLPKEYKRQSPHNRQDNDNDKELLLQ